MEYAKHIKNDTVSAKHVGFWDTNNAIKQNDLEYDTNIIKIIHKPIATHNILFEMLLA